MSTTRTMADDVRAALPGHEPAIITELLPAGIERSGKWHSLNPSRGDCHLGSFSVELSGQRAGLWFDFASGEGGDLFDLVRLVTGCDFNGALLWLARRCGIDAPDQRLKIRQSDPKAVAEWKRRESSGEARGRGCTIAMLAEAKSLPASFLIEQGLVELPAKGEWPAAVMIPYHRGGEAVATRFRSDVIAKQGSTWKRGSKPLLYGLDRLTGDEERILLVEGESDCWACWHAGIAAVGIPGASMWRDEWASCLPASALVYVVQEPGAAGSALVDALRMSPLAPRLRVVRLKAKDPADVWTADPDPARFRLAMEQAMQTAAIPQAIGIPSQAGAPAIILRSHADRDRERRIPGPMIVNDLAPEGGVCAFIAMPGVGKTLIGLELARCVASGSPFAGKSVAHGSVLYACTDAPASTERRTLAMSEEARGRIYTATELPLLPDGIDALRAAVESANAMADLPVRLVVLDTWDSCRAHSSGGYADQDGGAEDLMRGLRKLAADLHLAVVIIHHATRQEGGRARGTVVFDARCDWMAVVEKGGAGLVLKTTKARDGECGPVGTWAVVPVMVGSRSVPTLVEASVGRAELIAMDRSRMLLAAAHELAGEGKPPTARRLALAIGVKGGGAVDRLAVQLRSQGLMESDTYIPTAAGVDFLEGLGQSLGQPVQTGCRIGTEIDTAVKTKRPTGTDMRDAPNTVPLSHTYRGGTAGTRDKDEIDPEDLFANAPAASQVRA